ncbi:MAG: ribosome recycling factor [Candidatus Marinimicrobia bacterium]|nr:ribosome recycling factor [Candidatus Neomarinimicrobiota bacterium]
MEKFYNETTDNMNKVIEHYQREISIIRTGRASKDILDIVKVNYYGSMVPLNTIANITAPDSSMILVQPFDISSIEVIEKAIHEAQLGLNPNNDGKVIRLSVPPLTEERRNELIKFVHKLIEEGKVSIRNVRRDSNDKIKLSQKNNEISEDDLKRGLDKIQTITNEFIDKLVKIQTVKEEEIRV